jgi:UDP-hydrolysing UDP-N-acetyl-D-glucosamine 2-epimerase
VAVLLGDRYEILRAATDIYLLGIPIIHLSGGDITEGSQDDCMRHAITKLSHIHFPTNQASAKRIIQMGEEPWRVKVVGYPGVDADMQMASFEDAKKEVGLTEDNFLLVVWHPNTFADESQNLLEVSQVTSALNNIKIKCLIIGPNTDYGNETVRDHLFKWAKLEDHLYHFDLPRPVYLRLLCDTRCLVGNSSSGIYEAPTFGTPVVNIGDRQKGREKASNIVDCAIDYRLIERKIRSAVQGGRQIVDNPYQTGHAASKIAEEISKLRQPKKFLVKRFYEIKH